MNRIPVAPPDFTRHVHLLYAPTLACNLGCRYCYLGEQTGDGAADLREDAARAVSTLRYALDRLEDAGVLAFNVSLHGGEATMMPPAVLDGLFTLIGGHYRKHFDALNALGHRKSAPHIKTNLYKFASQRALFERHRVSVSASIDLPLSLHAAYRTKRNGDDWLDRTLENLRLLARYPHAKKISATVSQEHLADIPAFIRDIWFLHREIGFDMNQFNLMFAFASELNAAEQGEAVLTPATPAQQQALYDALHAEFTGTELEEGLRRHWFDEFKPSYCTNAYNCGERFYLLQSDGTVYSCVRGQGIDEFRYGNIFDDAVDDILAAGARKIRAIHQTYGFDSDCQGCGHLSTCHTGCPVVKYQSREGKSYTCGLQKRIYADYPRSYPADPPADQAAYARAYARDMHPALALQAPEPPPGAPVLHLPNDFYQGKNALQALIDADPVLQALYSPDAFTLEIGDEVLRLESQLLKRESAWHTLTPEDRVRIHLPKRLLDAACDEPVRNTLYLQMLRDTPVIYGDERRTKQAHLFTWQLFGDCLEPSPLLGPDYRMADLRGLIALHRRLYLPGVLNNLFFTTGYLRDYHYRKQKENAFYHIQAINLPFQNLEFFYLEPPGASS